MIIKKAGELIYDAKTGEFVIQNFEFSGEDKEIGFDFRIVLDQILKHPKTKFKIFNMPPKLLCKSKIEIRRFMKTRVHYQDGGTWKL